MNPEQQSKDAWQVLASLVNTLPPEERARQLVEIGKLIHDLRQAMGIASSSEAVLRRDANLPPEDMELLNLIRSSVKRALALLGDFARPFDECEDVVEKS